MKTHVALVRDHSLSMRGLERQAMQDFNMVLEQLKQSSTTDNEVFVTVVECGVGWQAEVKVPLENIPARMVSAMTSYVVSGSGTPLRDSVGKAINALQPAFCASEPNEAFLVMVITDGGENSSKILSEQQLVKKMQDLNLTDKWTFAFRVPRGNKGSIVRWGVPEWNVVEWEQNAKAFEASTVQTVQSVSSYFNARSTGATSSKSFFANIADISQTDLNNIPDVTRNTKVAWILPKHDGMQIRDFCIIEFGSYNKGKAFYQLTKTETVQEYKEIAIRDKTNGKIYKGSYAKSLLGLPSYGSVQLRPGQMGKFDLFVQSTSVNRKLSANTCLLIIE